MKFIDSFTALISSSISLEVSAYPKPGNVHRLSDHVDKFFEDFVVASHVAHGWIRRGVLRGYRDSYSKYLVGDIIYGMVKESMEVTGSSNTILGIAILLSPLSIALGKCLKEGVVRASRITSVARDVLEKNSTTLDSIALYRAIRHASPSYIRRSDKTSGPPNVWSKDYRRKILEGNYRLWEVLVASSSVDVVSKEVVEGYPRSLKAASYLNDRLNTHGNWNRAVVEAYLFILSKDIDTLVFRKHGARVAEEVGERAGEILYEVEKAGEEWFKQVIELDKDLRAKGINPGSAADITAATIALHNIDCRRRILRKVEQER
ncbi:MAG: triphosphoribosyl-dephospho-CoA synthase [Sulfolobales archaeon]|nr:triphosphoribosyl-dephospho-CoA synthase [Sulfolobales archaeon]MCX8198438.1 triphosphoribosyl-dephospho-CoA synthase [Sulfolobales archaeon]MDW8169512.1 triphosphoribosyl-dephospho-CoA synthase [Desulfurococcaceae archaeon]